MSNNNNTSGKARAFKKRFIERVLYLCPSLFLLLYLLPPPTVAVFLCITVAQSLSQALSLVSLLLSLKEKQYRLTFDFPSFSPH